MCRIEQRDRRTTRVSDLVSDDRTVHLVDARHADSLGAPTANLISANADASSSLRPSAMSWNGMTS